MLEDLNHLGGLLNQSGEIECLVQISWHMNCMITDFLIFPFRLTDLMLSKVVKNVFDELSDFGSANLLVDIPDDYGLIVNLLIHHFDFLQLIF